MKPKNLQFSEVVQAHWSGIYKLCYRMLGQPEDAEEVTQQTFLNALKAWRSFKGHSTVHTWLYRIAINACRQKISEKKKHKRISLVAEQVIHQDEVRVKDAVDEMKDRVNDAMMRLKPKYRLILTLFCIDGLSHSDIALMLDIPEGTVWSRLHTAKNNLRSEMKESLDD